MATDFIGNKLQKGDLVLCAVSGGSSSATIKFGIVEKIYKKPHKYFPDKQIDKLSLNTIENYGGKWYSSKSSHDDFRKMCKVSLDILPEKKRDKYKEQIEKLLKE